MIMNEKYMGLDTSNPLFAENPLGNVRSRSRCVSMAGERLVNDSNKRSFSRKLVPSAFRLILNADAARVQSPHPPAGL